MGFAAAALPWVLLGCGKPAGPPLEREALEALQSPVGASLAHAAAGDLARTRQDLALLEERWRASGSQESPTGRRVTRSLSEAKALAAAAGPSAPALSAALSRLAEAVGDLEVRQAMDPALDPSEKAAALRAAAEAALEAATGGRWADARAGLRTFAAGWPAIEESVRAANPEAYGVIEVQMSVARVELEREVPDAEEARELLDALADAVRVYTAATVPPAKRATLAEVIGIARETRRALEAGDLAAAAPSLQRLVRSWPSVEGEVQAKSARAYDEVERALTEAAAAVLSRRGDAGRAAEAVEGVVGALEPLAQRSRYTAWDAALILLREGLEALLAIASLLALLRKTGHADRQMWVWGGVGAGLTLSAAAAVGLSFATAIVASGSAQEGIEGFVGLAAVLLMLTVGAWLHGKSSIRAWNAFIRDRAGGALERGSYWSVALIACLAIAREGVETVVFYIGIAPSIAPGQLLLGVGAALLPLAGLGYLLIRFGVRLPLRQLFLAATLLIYYLAFKILGESIHSLQMAGPVPIHAQRGLPSLPLLGMYPSWETFVPQAVVGLLVLGEILLTEARHRRAAGGAPASGKGVSPA